MAAPTTLTVSIDQAEYSKIEPGRDTINVTWTATGSNMNGEVLLIELIKARRTRTVDVYSTTATITGTGSSVSGTASISLPDVVDSSYISLIRRGKYFVKVSSVTTPATYGVTADFPISVITAQELRTRYLFGLDLTSSEMRMVKYQPTQITGVEVQSMSTKHPMGFIPLTYHYSNVGGTIIRQLSWYGGPLVNITAPGTYLLRYDCNGTDYMVVLIRSLAALPTSSKTDDLYVEKSTITDSMIRSWIESACDWWENDKINVFLEPTRVVTDIDTTTVPDGDWDVVVPRITFFPSVPAKWIDINFPYPGLIKLNRLFGRVANVDIVEVDLSWVEVNERSGFAQLVPFNTTTAFRFIGLIWVDTLTGAIEIPNFWHFSATAGMRTLDPVVVEILGKKAGMDALVAAGQAYRVGLSSQSIGRDGVNESVSYTSSAIYGMFAATIEDYNKFINREIKNLRGRYRGVGMVVV